MNYDEYNCCCLVTSIIMFILIILKIHEVDLCIILLLAALFSIIWRSTKLIQGKNKIEKDDSDNNSLYHPLFILDFAFAVLGFLCVINSRQINHKFIYLTILVFLIAWTLYFINQRKTSRTIHFSGHCYVILVFFLTFYLSIR